MRRSREWASWKLAPSARTSVAYSRRMACGLRVVFLLWGRAMNQSSQALRLNPQKLRAATLPDRNLLLVGFLRHGACAGEGRGGGCVRPTASARPGKFYAPKRLQTPSRCRNLVIFSSLRRRALEEAPIRSPLSKARAPVRRDVLFGAAACKRSAMAFLPPQSSYLSPASCFPGVLRSLRVLEGFHDQKFALHIPPMRSPTFWRARQEKLLA